MANLKVKDHDAATKYLKATGAGTDGDAYIVEHEVTQAAADDLKTDANLQVGDADVANGNPVPISDAGGAITVDGAVTLGANSGVDIGDVDVTSVAAGETHLGEVGAATLVKEITFTLDTNAYADGDVLAATQEIASAVRVNAGTGIIQSVIILDKDDQGENLDVVFLKTNVSIGTENAAVSITDANADEIQGIVEVDSYVDLVGSQLSTNPNLGIGVQADSAATSLFIALISRGTGTYTASGITAKITILQD